MKRILITTLALTFARTALAMEEPTLKQQIEHARSEIATVRASADEMLKEEGLSAGAKMEIENKKFELAVLSFQTTAVDCIDRLIEALEKQAKKEQQEASKVRINGSTQVTMDDENEDDFVVVSDPKPADLIPDDKVTKL